MTKSNDDQAKLNEYARNKKNVIYLASHMSSVTDMGHFYIAKTKETSKYFYLLMLPLKKKTVFHLFISLLNYINIVLCQSTSFCMSTVTYMGHVNLKLNQRHNQFVFCTILSGMASRILCYNMRDKDLILLKKT